MTSSKAETSLLLPRPRQRLLAAEEYVLDERLLGGGGGGGPRGVAGAPALIAPPRHHHHHNHHHQSQQQANRQQQRRSAAELRTVSIIDTLSELVQAGGPRGARSHSGGHPHPHHHPGDCDGQCRPPPPPPPTNAGRLQRLPTEPASALSRPFLPPAGLGTSAAATTSCSGATPLDRRWSRGARAECESVPRSVAANYAGGGRRGMGVTCGPTGRDPNHFMLSTLQSKGRTPDWIAGIFSIARRGNLHRLSHALTDMDATLIRNLSDHRGNNLFHVCCCYGHLDCLQWLLQRGRQCEDAILDENKYELTPLVCAVKYGKLPCVEWLIGNSKARSQLAPNNGSRPLLHWAAKYGQEVILKWLAAYMENNGMDVNVRDGYGNTSLHLAAKHGHAVSIKALVSHCCDVCLRNDLGHKASDYAALYSQTACSEYLLSLEACLLLSSDVASLDTELGSARVEMADMKTQFKDVLACSKKLVKEREELSHHLARLQDGIVHLNSVIITEIKSLCQENKLLREKFADPEIRHDTNSHQTLDETIALCHAMHTRWQEGQQRWLSTGAISDIQKKLILAEERWKRAQLNARLNWAEKEPKQHMNVFRERLSQVQCRSSGIRLSDIRSISSSESSLASMEEQMTEYESQYGDDYEATFFAPPPITPRTTTAQTLAATPHQHNCACHTNNSGFLGTNTTNNHHRSTLAPLVPTQLSVNAQPDSKSKTLAHKADAAVAKPTNKCTKLVSTSAPDKDRAGGREDRWASAACSSISPEVSLVSLSGCKVLEVIVSSDDGESLDGAVHTSTPKSKVDGGECSSSTKRIGGSKPRKSGSGGSECKVEMPISGQHDDDDEEETAKGGRRPAERAARSSHSSGATGGGGSSGKVTEPGDLDERRNRANEAREEETTDVGCNKPNLYADVELTVVGGRRVSRLDGQLTFSEPDLIIGTKGIRNSADAEPSPDSELVSVTREESSPSVSGARQGAAPTGGGNVRDHGEAEDGVDSDELSAAEDDRCEDDLFATSVADDCVSMGPNEPLLGSKRRGGRFLQKLNSMWPSSRRRSHKGSTATASSSSKKVKEITPGDFRDTYHCTRTMRNGGGEDGQMEGSIGGDCASGLQAESEERADNCSAEFVSAPVPMCRSSVAAAIICRSSSAVATTTNTTTGQEEMGDARSNPPPPPKPRSKMPVVSDVSEKPGNKFGGGGGGAEVSLVSRASVHVEPGAGGGGSLDSVASCVTVRDVPIPPLPATVDESVSDGNKELVPTGASVQTSRQELMLFDRGDEEEEDEEDEDDRSVGESKDSCRPEADQHSEHGAVTTEEDPAARVHAKAGLPPQRPISRGAKSDQSAFSLSRPESSASRTESCTGGGGGIYQRLSHFSLRKVSASDLLADSLTPSRASPAPSEVSKTESALLSPPSETASKTESMRHLRQLGRIEETGVQQLQQQREAMPPVVAVLAMRRLTAEVRHASAVISDVDAGLDGGGKKQMHPGLVPASSSKGDAAPLVVPRRNSKEDLVGVADPLQTSYLLLAADCPTETKSNIAASIKKMNKDAKPWYELSDDEEGLMPETLNRNLGAAKNTSEDENEVFFCT